MSKWCKRYSDYGLYDEIRPGKTRSVSVEAVAELIKKTWESTPKGSPHWSMRTMAWDHFGESNETRLLFKREKNYVGKLISLSNPGMKQQPLYASAKLFSCALAVSEVNASGGNVVTAPTCGAVGCRGKWAFPEFALLSDGFHLEG